MIYSFISLSEIGIITVIFGHVGCYANWFLVQAILFYHCTCLCCRCGCFGRGGHLCLFLFDHLYRLLLELLLDRPHVVWKGRCQQAVIACFDVGEQDDVFGIDGGIRGK